MFQEFTNQYQLSKTLRFELKPIGSDGERLSAQEATESFAEVLEKDRKIKEAYTALKPIMDGIHENIINKSLTSSEALQIDFTKYLEEYKKGKDKKLGQFEETLRESIGKTFVETTQNYKIIKKTKKKEEQKTLFEIKKDVPMAKAEIIDYLLEQHKNDTELCNHIKEFKGFFGYFDGYNKNRANYYEYKKEASTAVATRIVHENLPRFCDNAIQFEKMKDEYLGVLPYLKDAQTNTMIEAEAISKDWFAIEKFSDSLAQAGIENYNRIIGHYNLLINLYNQARKSEKDFKKLKPFKTLHKQIGCGRKKALFDELKSDEELKETLQSISEAGEKYFKKSNDINLTTIYTFINWLKENDDWSGVYWSKTAVDIISSNYLSNWHDIKDRIQDVLKKKAEKGQKLSDNEKELKELLKSVASYDKKREEQLKLNDAVELSGLFKILDEKREAGWSEIFFKKSILEERKSLINETKTPSENLINLLCADMESMARCFCIKSARIAQISDYKNEDNILSVKKWLDASKSLLKIVKYFDVKESKVKGSSINPELTNMLTSILRAEDVDWFKSYDLVRNYLSKKPQDDAKKNKLKLNFESSTFLNGLSQDFDSKAGLIFEKSGLYYLVINYNLLKDDIKMLKQINGSEVAKRVIIDFQKPDNKNTPRLFIRSKGDSFAPSVEKYDLPIEKIISIYDSGSYKTEYRKKNEQEYNRSLWKLIDYFKLGFKRHESYKHYDFEWKETSEYKDIAEFYHDTEKSCYQINKEDVSWDSLLKFVQDKKIYLFQVYSKDFSQDKKSSGTDNLHTLYWKSLFEKNAIHKFGTQGAEIFFRKQAIFYDPEKLAIGHHANDPKKKQKYPIIKDKRFTMDKFQFHCPIVLNYKADGNNDTNEVVNDNFTKTDDIQFLGIDRGEKHLIYYSLLNAKGEIIEQNHLDVIGKKDYLEEINKAAAERKLKQENWQQKGKISNLKDGYISLVVHEIIEKMKDKDGNYKPTFIVLEDLNTGFKRGRQKFEQQVYQKFELALAKKLNYLVDKNAKMGEIGSVAQALQFTPPVSNYQDIENRKQVGIMLYTRANYTSVTDPATGWRKNIYLKKGSEADIKTQILETFSEIGVEGNDYFFQYEDKNGKGWKLWSSKDGKSLERYKTERKDKGQYETKPIDVKTILDKVFEKFDKTKSIKQQLEGKVELTKCKDKYTASESLRFAIDMIQQIRNSGDVNKNQDDNFLLSPMRNEQGEHFDSHTYEKQENPKLPKDADANGAYNIARKGIVMYEHIKQWVDDGKQKDDLDLYVSDKEWDLWLTDKKSWEEQLSYFASKKAKAKD